MPSRVWASWVTSSWGSPISNRRSRSSVLQASASAVIRDTGRKAAFSTQRPAKPTMISSTAVKARRGEQRHPLGAVVGGHGQPGDDGADTRLLDSTGQAHTAAPHAPGHRRIAQGPPSSALAAAVMSGSTEGPLAVPPLTNTHTWEPRSFMSPEGFGKLTCPGA